jgi:two-component system response regulator SaeR
MKILCIEDHEPILDVLEFTLEKKKNKVFKATTIEKAIDIYKSNEIDVVILDIFLDGKYNGPIGFQFVQQLKDMKRCYFIAISALCEKTECIQNGFDDYLPKPFVIYELYDVIEKAKCEIIRRKK